MFWIMLMVYELCKFSHVFGMGCVVCVYYWDAVLSPSKAEQPGITGVFRRLEMCNMLISLEENNMNDRAE